MTRPLVFPWLGSMATPAKKHYREDRMPINEKKRHQQPNRQKEGRRTRSVKLQTLLVKRITIDTVRLIIIKLQENKHVKSRYALQHDR